MDNDEFDNEEEREETIEDLMKRVAAEDDAERKANEQAKLERKVKAKKLKEDRDYEKYWNRLTEKPGMRLDHLLDRSPHIVNRTCHPYS